MSLNDELLPDYKLDVPHTPPRVILHYTTFKTTWDWIILFLTLYTTVSVPFIVCFNFENLGLAVLDLIVDWLFLADIGLNFHTTYVGKDGEVIDNLKMIRWNYLRTWFFFLYHITHRYSWSGRGSATSRRQTFSHVFTGVSNSDEQF